MLLFSAASAPVRNKEAIIASCIPARRLQSLAVIDLTSGDKPTSGMWIQHALTKLRRRTTLHIQGGTLSCMSVNLTGSILVFHHEGFERR